MCIPKPTRVLARNSRWTEGKEEAKHEKSEAEAKTFKQEVLSEIQEMMLSDVETERVTWLKDRSCEVLPVAMSSSSLYSEAALGALGDDCSVFCCAGIKCHNSKRGRFCTREFVRFHRQARGSAASVGLALLLAKPFSSAEDSEILQSKIKYHVR